MLLADLGAVVIKIEPPEGDPTRTFGPFRKGDRVRAYGGYFQSLNRNKLGLTIDLKNPEERKQFLHLVRQTDVVVENFRSGVMEELELGFERLLTQNPRLVYAAVRGFGDPRTGSSPYADWPAYDVIAQAMGGLVACTGYDEDHPTKVGPGVGDIFPGALTAVGVLAALHHVQLSGQGQFVDVAMYDAMISLCERSVYLYSYNEVVAAPEGNGHPFLVPFDVVRAADGWVAIAAPTDRYWTQLCTLMGLPGLSRDPRYASLEARQAHAPAVRELISDWARSRSRLDIVRLLGGLVPVGSVQSGDEILADPHIYGREMIFELPHPGVDEPVRVAGTPIKFTLTRPSPPVRAPLLGEHDQYFLVTKAVEEQE